ncbi:formate dehydrogenase subunit gamma [Nitrogeniibacter mangrovi]|uniref:Formate dehydrogenase subunit gamma n=1 Tax=Nitrogeniibacter mangrovi TaxID=2016596 RepID=A0A6C1AY83_9RHOO|nr:formate dehydrogenase subunit gamma [Nitrogeniibacter mangrovi]QID16321.1 formate dehydrogenase subunit gamma [Nitrogeniibacter mangrovi]
MNGRIFMTLRAMLLACALGLGLATVPALAEQSGQAAATERHNNVEVFREIRRGENQSITFQAPADRRLIQSEGETWRQWRNGPITFYGGWALALMFVALVLFYAIRGKIKLEEAPTGRKIARFSLVERTAHWSVAICFVILGLTGLTLLFGKHLVVPLIGYSAFSWLAVIAKNLHNFIGPLFFVSIVLFALMFVRDNVWQPIDALWIRKAGGLLSGEHVPSWRFNFGEKTWFWLGVVFLGLLVSITGLVMDFPGNGQTRQNMQLAHILHASGALLFLTLSLAHIYIGTVGMEGALEGMKTGYVDETWAKEHHEYWYREAKGKAPSAQGGIAQGSASPAR